MISETTGEAAAGTDEEYHVPLCRIVKTATST